MDYVDSPSDASQPSARESSYQSDSVSTDHVFSEDPSAIHQTDTDAVAAGLTTPDALSIELASAPKSAGYQQCSYDICFD